MTTDYRDSRRKERQTAQTQSREPGPKGTNRPDVVVTGCPLSSHGSDKQAARTKAASVQCFEKSAMGRGVATKERSFSYFPDSVFSLKLDADVWQVAKVATDSSWLCTHAQR